jgi:Cft2 family RNA processing exonuclease
MKKELCWIVVSIWVLVICKNILILVNCKIIRIVIKKLCSEPFDEIIDVVLISHFHLDHCGALPYFTEILGYNGPIIMTSPTKAILPYMLEDFRKVMLDTKI